MNFLQNPTMVYFNNILTSQDNHHHHYHHMSNAYEKNE